MAISASACFCACIQLGVGLVAMARYWPDFSRVRRMAVDAAAVRDELVRRISYA